MFLIVALFFGVNAWCESRLIDLENNRVGYISSILAEISSGGEPIGAGLSYRDKQDYLNKAWASQFPSSSILKNGDLATHLQMSSYENLFPTKTILGRVYGDHMLKTGATTDIAGLQKRQDWIRTLGSVPKIDDSFLELLHPTGPLDAYIKAGYLSAQKPVAEDGDVGQVPFVLSNSEPGWLLLKDPLRLPSFVVAKYATLLAIPAEILTQKAIFSGFFSIQEYGCGAFLRGCGWRLGSALLGAGSLAGFAWMNQYQYQTHNRLYNFNIFLTKRLKTLGVFLETLSRIASDPVTPNELRPRIGLGALEGLQNILSDIHSLDDTDSNFFQANLVRAMMIAEHVFIYKPVLEHLLINWGALDFYGSIQGAGFSYVNFIDTTEPLFEAKNLRHPSLPKNIAVKNDISLTHMLLTGPNASGKSTLMRAIGINAIYLAQTLGIATADSLSMTPFHGFYAFMETTDKTGESSSYQTELRRITDALRTHTKLGFENKRSFYLADELFSSTNAADALTGSREILSRFANLKQSTGIVSTHLFDLSNLEQTQPALQNFHMKAYQVEKGASAERHALKILDHEFMSASHPRKANLGPKDIFKRFYSNSSSTQNLIYQILAPQMSDKRELQIDSDIWADLEFFDVPGKVLPLQTTIGEVWAVRFFSQAATPNIEKIRGRQEKIKRFSENPELLRQIREQLEVIHSFESSLLEIYDKSDWINGSSVRQLYPQDEEATLKLIEKILPESMSETEKQAVLEMHFRNRIRPENRNVFEIAKKQILQVYAVLPLALYSTYKVGSWVWKSSENPALRAYYVLWTAFSLKNVLSDPLGEHYRLEELAPRFVRKLKDVSRVFHAVLELSYLTGDEIPTQDRMAMEQFMREVDALGRDSLSAALASFRLLMDIRKPFIRQLKKIGQLDFYASAAQAMLDDPTKFSFVKFTDGQDSYLEAKNLWNPLLTKESAVTNHISMGGSTYSRKILITGPNASGKSTFMRTVAINIYLAQTLGMVAASSMELSPFTIFNSFMKHEDLVGEDSSYQSEVRNMRKIINLYEKMLTHDRAFLILDEPFRSTNPDEAEAASGIVLEQLGRYPQNLMMVATHLRNLTDFGANKHLENYELKEGISYDSSALEMLRRELGED